MCVYVKTAASGGLVLLSPVQTGSTLLTGEVVVGQQQLQNLGAEEFSAWMAVNSNYGAGRVMG